MKNSYKVLIAVSLVVGLIALGLGAVALNHASVAPETQLTGVYNNNLAAPGASAGIDFGSLPINVNWAGGKIGSKLNTAFWRNTTGQTVYVDMSEMSTDGTASSSFKMYAYATTSAPNTLYDFLAPSNVSGTTLLISGFAIATSSTATTTNSDDLHYATGAGAFAGNTVQVPNNSYVDFVLAGKDTGCASQAGRCETATSSNRGFNIQWRLRYHN